ncbi:monooxygenase [Litoribacillus peritrichatus]|uniref:Monooxygenase n=2 Tax=Litoribacillus peritrichatus TaxID=718191 RepID=A0ABP7N0S7_9GAMM
MTTLVHIDYPFKGPFGPALTEKFKSLAEETSNEPGLLWKIWTENPQQEEAGGVYLFQNESQAQKYLEKYLGKMISNGITEVRARIVKVHSELSDITNAPLSGQTTIQSSQ